MFLKLDRSTRTVSRVQRVLFLDLGVRYEAVVSLWEFIKQNICDMWISLYTEYSSKNIVGIKKYNFISRYTVMF
jgi:hypothetical protein